MVFFFVGCWIGNREVDPKGDRVITITWGRNSTHYHLLIPEGDNIIENTPMQLQNIFSCCSLYEQSLSRVIPHRDKPSSPE